jgi:hypothetical protein
MLFFRERGGGGGEEEDTGERILKLVQMSSCLTFKQ